MFDPKILKSYSKNYAKSTPYKHAVIEDLVDDKLLRAVRYEIRTNVSFTPKETDIYKIHQSGDLKCLDGLEDEALAKLPSLLALRDAMYSETFRNYVATITGCGPLSGRKTDMAINVYTPGCYLLCHDDVIGSRKVSYILYLTDPDTPWKSEWGGALRLYPVVEREGDDGEVAKIPSPDASRVIPPAWNQLSFFAVQPGESFHDVEEVYHAETKEQLDRDGGRVRMAISGWFHVPQIGEDGYVEGAEELLAKHSSLMQLQGNPDKHDLPQPQPSKLDNPQESQSEFDEQDLEFLLKYIAPTYLTPDTLEQVSEHFDENSSITLPAFLSTKFSGRLKEYVVTQESLTLPENSTEVEKSSPWKVARPPHKHRFLFQQPSGPDELRTSQDESPITELLDILLPSRQFRQWLQLATRCTVEGHDLLARRFRRGQDYTLATGHDGKARIELNLGFTPTAGWGEDDDEVPKDEEPSGRNDNASSNGNVHENGNGNRAKANSGTKDKGKTVAGNSKQNDKAESEDVGGHEVYMAGDDDGNDDAAVYKASADDDNILFFQAAAWNKLTIVLRDGGALRFVKYISRAAAGDRWDISGIFEAEEQAEDGDETDGEEAETIPLGESEEEFNGFSDDDDGSESD